MNTVLSRVDTRDRLERTAAPTPPTSVPASAPTAPIDRITLRLGLWLVARAERPRRRVFDAALAAAVRREHDLTVLRAQARQIRPF